MKTQKAPQWGSTNYNPPPVATGAPRKHRRWFMWSFLAIQLLFLIWVIAGANSGAGIPDDCGTLSREACNEAENAGTAIGVGLLILLWAITDIIVGITYAVIRLARR